MRVRIGTTAETSARVEQDVRNGTDSYVYAASHLGRLIKLFREMGVKYDVGKKNGNWRLSLDTGSDILESWVELEFDENGQFVEQVNFP